MSHTKADGRWPVVMADMILILAHPLLPGFVAVFQSIAPSVPPRAIHGAIPSATKVDGMISPVQNHTTEAATGKSEAIHAHRTL